MQKVLDRIHLSYIMFENHHFHLPESQNGKRRQHVAGWLDTVFAEMHCMLVFPVNGMRNARHFVQQCQSRSDRNERPAGSVGTSRPERVDGLLGTHSANPQPGSAPGSRTLKQKCNT